MAEPRTVGVEGALFLLPIAGATSPSTEGGGGGGGGGSGRAQADESTDSGGDTALSYVAHYAQTPIVHTASLWRQWQPLGGSASTTRRSASCACKKRVAAAPVASCPRTALECERAGLPGAFVLRAGVNRHTDDGVHRVHAASRYTLCTSVFVELPADCYAIVGGLGDFQAPPGGRDGCDGYSTSTDVAAWLRVDTRLLSPGSAGRVSVKLANACSDTCVVVQPGAPVAQLVVVRRTPAHIVQLDDAALEERHRVASQHTNSVKSAAAAARSVDSGGTGEAVAGASSFHCYSAFAAQRLIVGATVASGSAVVAEVSVGKVNLRS